VALVFVVVIGALTVAVVLVVASLAVLREAARMDREPPTRAFDAGEALAWVVQHIPDEAAGSLTVDDVERIIDLQLEYFRRKGVSRNGKDTKPAGTVVVGGSETIEYIIGRAADDGAVYTPDQVHAVIETQLTYLRSIGVVGDRVDEGIDEGIDDAIDADSDEGDEPDRPNS